MTHLRKMMLEELQGRKITVLMLLVVLGLVEDSMVRSDSRVFGVAGSSSKCKIASIVW
jgi:hypothetical protein